MESHTLRFHLMLGRVSNGGLVCPWWVWNVGWCLEVRGMRTLARLAVIAVLAGVACLFVLLGVLAVLSGSVALFL